MFELEQVESGGALDEVRSLFVEYGQSLNFNLCFQSFDEELRDLPGPYVPPAGQLILARLGGRAAGRFRRTTPIPFPTPFISNFFCSVGRKETSLLVSFRLKLQ